MGDEQKEDEALPDNLNGTLSIRVGKRSEIAKENFTFKISECYAVFEAKIKQYVSKPRATSPSMVIFGLSTQFVLNKVIL